MDALHFYQQFLEKTYEELLYEGKKYWDIYRTDEPLYTELVNKHIIHEIIESAGYETQHEYVRIDTVGWQGRYKEILEDEAKRVLLNRHFWDLKIAVEHENSKEDWMDEVIKLIHVRCPLKVVIGYVYCDRRGEEEIEQLKFIAKWMQEISAFNPSDKEEYLIILGNGRPKNLKNDDYNKFDYRGYLFEYQLRQFKAMAGACPHEQIMNDVG